MPRANYYHIFVAEMSNGVLSALWKSFGCKKKGEKTKENKFL